MKTNSECVRPSRVVSFLSEADCWPGSLHPQYVRCGKAGCHCKDGDKHGPYWYLLVRIGRRQVKFYVRPGDAEAARQKGAASQSANRLRRQTRRANLACLRDLRQRLRALNQDLKG